ncbi:MAG TPA: AI-2E family transporter [Gemmatimonadaceae bacterium]|nr:AI-2E family transporter [Gemmatimonadaceae bacterium]
MTAFLIALKVLWVASDVFLVLFLGVLFGLAVSAGAERLARFHIPRGMGAPLIVFGTIGIIFGAGSLVAPALTSQVNELKKRLPEAVQRVEGWVNVHKTGIVPFILQNIGAAPSDESAAAPQTQAAPQAPAAPSAQPGKPNPQEEAAADTTTPTGSSILRSRLGGAFQAASRYVFAVLGSTVAVVAFAILIIMISIFVGVEPALYRRGIVALVPLAHRARVEEVLSETGRVLRRWLVTQLIAMLMVGTLTSIALLALGVRAPLALGFIAGFLEFIPTVGPILSAIPALAMAFLDSPQKALAVVILYFMLQQLEGHVIIPILMKEGMNLPPVITIIAQAVMAIVFGFLGLMVAVPLVAAAMTLIRMLYVEDVVEARGAVASG